MYTHLHCSFSKPLHVYHQFGFCQFHFYLSGFGILKSIQTFPAAVSMSSGLFIIRITSKDRTHSSWTLTFAGVLASTSDLWWPGESSRITQHTCYNQMVTNNCLQSCFNALNAPWQGEGNTWASNITDSGTSHLPSWDEELYLSLLYSSEGLVF